MLGTNQNYSPAWTQLYASRAKHLLDKGLVALRNPLCDGVPVIDVAIAHKNRIFHRLQRDWTMINGPVVCIMNRRKPQCSLWPAEARQAAGGWF